MEAPTPAAAASIEPTRTGAAPAAARWERKRNENTNASSTEQANGQINAIESPRGIAAEWQGGQALLWQHLFWMWGHPWVYTIVLPAQGIVSNAILSFCRRPLVGYTAVALSTVATMMLGFGVWVHHVIATGLPTIGLSIFSASTIVISLPSTVPVFAWIATIWLGRPDSQPHSFLLRALSSCS